MYVYTQDDRRLYGGLSAFWQSWLDYWLYLHGYESSACLAARPVSPLFLAKAILASSAVIDNALLRSAQSIVQRLAGPSQTTLPQAPSLAIVSKHQKSFVIEPAWLHWAESVTSETQAAYREDLLRLLVKADEDGNYRLGAFASRRVATELAADDRSPQALFSKAKHSMLQLGKSPAEILRELMDPARERQEFVVELDLAPVFVPGRVASRRVADTITLITSKRPDEIRHIPSFRLEALRCTVNTDDANQAVIEAVALAASVVHDLRVRDYIRTYLTGTARVLTGGDPAFLMSLPQPFWTPGPARKEVPRLPARLLSEANPAWSAALEHLAIAFSLWVEAPHAAASNVWQSLESVGVRHSSLGQYVGELSQLIAERELNHAATKFRAFRKAMAQFRDVEDWYFWSGDYPATTWAGRVLHRDSSNRASAWKDQPPVAWFDLSDGIIPNLWRASAGLSTWFATRLSEDLGLLYAVRNAFVHKGSRFGNRRLAEHVARVGLECLVALAVKQASAVPRSTTAAQQGAAPDG